MNDDDRYIRITLRIPKDLHQKLSMAADDTSKSLNAEIVGRLQGSVEGPSGEEIKTLYKDLEIARLNAQKERGDGLGAKLIAAQLAGMVDPQKLADNPSLASMAMALRSQEREIMLDILENTILGMVLIPSIMRRGLKQGNLTLASDGQGTKWGEVPAAIRSQSSSLQETLVGLDESMLLELFGREKVREVLSSFDDMQEASEKNAGIGSNPAPIRKAKRKL